MGNKIKYLILVVVLFLVGFIFYKKFHFSHERVKTHKVVSKKEQKGIFGIGNIGAKDMYLVSSQVGGKVLSLKVDEGDFVKKDELLCEIDSVDLPILLKQKKSILKKNILELESLEKEKDSLLIKKDLAYKNFKRYEVLKKKGFVSESEFDKVNSDFIVAKNEFLVMKDKIASLKLQIDISKKDIKSIEKKLSLYKIYSPTDGYVISKNISKGDIVLPSHLIYKVVNPKDVWVKAYIDERVAGDIKVGDMADIVLRSHPKQILKGFVKRVELESNPITLEREVDVAFKKTPIPFFINEEADVTIYPKR